MNPQDVHAESGNILYVGRKDTILQMRSVSMNGDTSKRPLNAVLVSRRIEI